MTQGSNQARSLSQLPGRTLASRMSKSSADLREICERGFDGTHQLVYIWTKQKGYQKKGILKQSEKPPTTNQAPIVRTRSWAASRAAWLLVLEKNYLKQEEALALDRMTQAEPQVETAMKLAQEFLGILRTRQADILPDWLKRARESEIEALKGFVNGPENDLCAVTAAFSLPWSNGPTEGNVNRLKLIKR